MPVTQHVGAPRLWCGCGVLGMGCLAQSGTEGIGAALCQLLEAPLLLIQQLQTETTFLHTFPYLLPDASPA